MTVRAALAVDRLVGTPLCWVLNVVTRAVGMILRRDHSPPYRPRRILLIKMMGVGSIVQALPLIDGLARRYPEAEIGMLCFPETEILTARLAPVSWVFTIDNRSLGRLAWTTLTQLVAILRWRPDLALDLEYHSKFSSLLATLTAAENRGGLFDVTTQFRSYLHTHLLYANPGRHVGDLYEQLGRAFGVESFRALEECRGCVRIGPEEEAEVERTLGASSVGRDEPLLVLNPNAGELCLERRWPAERFARVADRMAAHGRVLLVGSPGERAYVESVRLLVPQAVRACVLNLAGALSFGAFLALLRRAAIVVTNDSGPMHLGALLGARVVSLWGPGSPARYQPRTSKHLAVWENVFCSPCLYITREPPCGGDNICMKQMTVATVLRAIATLAPEFAVAPGPEDGALPPRPKTGLAGLTLRNPEPSAPEIAHHP